MHTSTPNIQAIDKSTFFIEVTIVVVPPIGTDSVTCHNIAGLVPLREPCFLAAERILEPLTEFPLQGFRISLSLLLGIPGRVPL